MRTRRRKPGARAISHPRLRGVANRPNASSAAWAHLQRLLTVRSAAPATGASARQTPSGGFAFQLRRPLEGRKRTSEQHALREPWVGEQSHSLSGFAMTLPFPLS